jgi:FdhE protein
VTPADPPGAGTPHAPWAARRRRAGVLREQYGFAAEVLSLYLALLDTWEEGWDAAREDRPEPRHLAQWAAQRLAPQVVKATEAVGPEPLAARAGELARAGGLEGLLAAWLAGRALGPAERYLARASLHAPLTALADQAGAACAADPAPRGGRRCPGCAGLPQLSFRSDADDPLVSGHRYLLCSRCGHSWSYSASSCAYCGETSGSRRTIYAERRDEPVIRGGAAGHAARQVTPADAPTFPHASIDACGSCQHYLIDIDIARDRRAVPEVDELAALPLGLFAAERGLFKITPNLMGF